MLENDNFVVDDFATQLSLFQTTMKFHLQEAQDRYKVFANTIIKESFSFQVGIKV